MGKRPAGLDVYLNADPKEDVDPETVETKPDKRFQDYEVGLQVGAEPASAVAVTGFRNYQPLNDVRQSPAQFVASRP